MQNNFAKCFTLAQLKAAVANSLVTEIVIARDIVIPDGVKVRIPQTQVLSPLYGGFDFQNGTGQLEIDGHLRKQPNKQIFFNAISLPESPNWGDGVATTELPSVYGQFLDVRHPGWWGLFEEDDAQPSLQKALDSIPRRNDRMNGGIIQMPEGFWTLHRSVDLTYRYAFELSGMGRWATEVITNGNDFVGSSMFKSETTGNHWHFGVRVNNMKVFPIGGNPVDCFAFSVPGEGTVISDMNASLSGAFVRINNNSLGFVMRDCNVGAATTNDSVCLLRDQSFRGRTLLTSNTFVGQSGGPIGAVAAIRAEQGAMPVIDRLHYEGCHHGVIIGSRELGRFSDSGHVSISAMDGNAWIAPDPSSSNPFRHSSSHIGVVRWEATQVNAQMLTDIFNRGNRPQFWLKNLDLGDTASAPTSGEIPYVLPGASGGQASYNNLIHNSGARNNPTIP